MMSVHLLISLVVFYFWYELAKLQVRFNAYHSYLKPFTQMGGKYGGKRR